MASPQTAPRGHKILTVLDALAAAVGPQRLGDLAAATGLTKPTLHRLLAVLSSDGWAVARDGGFYELGPRARALGTAAGGAWGDLVEKAIRELAADVNQAVHVGVLAGGTVLYTHKAAGPQAFAMRSRVGSRMPVHSTGVGKAMLARLPEDEVRSIVAARGLQAWTATTITRVEDLLAELEQVRRDGYAVDREENEANVRCIAVPLCVAGRTTGALSVSTIAFLTPLEELLAMVPRLQATARVIAEELG